VDEVDGMDEVDAGGRGWTRWIESTDMERGGGWPTGAPNQI